MATCNFIVNWETSFSPVCVSCVPLARASNQEGRVRNQSNGKQKGVTAYMSMNLDWDQATEQILPPLAPPVAVYANLPIEWPLARISVYMRHVSALLRVTLNRRLAELSFRGVDFQHLPREVVRHTKEDFDTICGAMAAQLAALFAFLQPSQGLLPARTNPIKRRPGARASPGKPNPKSSGRPWG